MRALIRNSGLKLRYFLRASISSYYTFQICTDSSLFFFLFLWLILNFLCQAGKVDFETLEKKAMEWGEPKVPSAKQVIQKASY